MLSSSFIFTGQNHDFLNSTLTQYQFTGLKKLAAFRDHFYYNTSDLNQVSPAAPIQIISEQFTNIFCEYQLADTNYISNFLQSGRYRSTNEWLQQMDVQGIIKYLTYIIWTDKARAGYLESKFKDNTIFLLLGRLEQLLT